MIELYIVFWNVFSLHCWKPNAACTWNQEQEYSIQLSTGGVTSLVTALNKRKINSFEIEGSQYVDDIYVRKLGQDVTEDFNRTSKKGE